MPQLRLIQYAANLQITNFAKQDFVIIVSQNSNFIHCFVDCFVVFYDGMHLQTCSTDRKHRSIMTQEVLYASRVHSCA